LKTLSEPDQDLLTACRSLKEAGYTLALDDYTIANTVQNPLIELADTGVADGANELGDVFRQVFRVYGELYFSRFGEFRCIPPDVQKDLAKRNRVALHEGWNMVTNATQDLDTLLPRSSASQSHRRRKLSVRDAARHGLLDILIMVYR